MVLFQTRDTATDLRYLEDAKTRHEEALAKARRVMDEIRRY